MGSCFTSCLSFLCCCCSCFGRGRRSPNERREETEPLLQHEGQVARPSRGATSSEQVVHPTAKWYHGPMSHIEAEDRCANRFGKPPADGAYLVCRVGKDYYLYVCYKQIARKFKILHRENEWELESELHPDTYRTLEELVENHQTVPIKLKNGKKVTLKTIVAEVEEQ